jgi:hypothetical protein
MQTKEKTGCKRGDQANGQDDPGTLPENFDLKEALETWHDELYRHDHEFVPIYDKLFKKWIWCCPSEKTRSG